MEDLKLDGTKYNIALSIFFVPYILLDMDNYQCIFGEDKLIARITTEVPSKHTPAQVQTAFHLSRNISYHVGRCDHLDWDRSEFRWPRGLSITLGSF